MKLHIIPLKLFVLAAIAIDSFFFSSAYAYSNDWPLRGKGEVRYLKMIKVYDASLYSPKLVTAQNILKPNVSKCLKLDYAVDLSVDKFRLATSKILKRQHDAEFLRKINTPLETLQGAYKAVRKGDYYRLCYDGKTQKMRLDLNQKKLVEIRSAELARAYLGIWLSANKPISSPLYRRFFQQTTK